MAEPLKRVRFAVKSTTLLLMGLLVLQALGYGIGFFFDPASGLGEFASPPPPAGNELTIALVGLLGVGMLGTVALLVLSAILVVRRNPVGAYIAMVVGGIYILAGVSVFRSGWTWDASFYAGSGAALLLLSAAVRSLDKSAAPKEE